MNEAYYYSKYNQPGLEAWGRNVMSYAGVIQIATNNGKYFL